MSSALVMPKDPHPDSTMAGLDNLTVLANNLSLKHEYATDLRAELLALGATSEEATKYSVSSIDRIPLVMAQGRTMNFCKGCGQETSLKRPHKCHDIQRATFERQLRTDGWAGAFATFRRRGWVPDMNPEQVRKARSDIMKSGAPKRSMVSSRGERAVTRILRRDNMIRIGVEEATHQSKPPAGQVAKMEAEIDVITVDPRHNLFRNADLYRPSYGSSSWNGIEGDRAIMLEPRDGPAASYDSYRPVKKQSSKAVDISSTQTEPRETPVIIQTLDPEPQRHLQRRERRRETREKAAAKQAAAKRKSLISNGPQSLPTILPPPVQQQQLPSLNFSSIQATFNEMSLD